MMDSTQGPSTASDPVNPKPASVAAGISWDLPVGIDVDNHIRHRRQDLRREDADFGLSAADLSGERVR